MFDTVFCCTCWKLHPRDLVVLVQSKGVKRWRCLRSIVESPKRRDRLDLVVMSGTGMKQPTGLRKAMLWLPRSTLELFNGAPGRLEERP